MQLHVEKNIDLISQVFITRYYTLPLLRWSSLKVAYNIIEKVDEVSKIWR